MKDKLIAGSLEWVELPELNTPAIKARVDSGAKTSSLHASNIEVFYKGEEKWVKFDVYPLENSGKKVVHCESKLVDKRIVKSSSGEKDSRFVIKTTFGVANQKWDVELTLTNRDAMGYRMLIGREAMIGRMLVDPELEFNFGNYNEAEIENFYPNEKRHKRGLKMALLSSNLKGYTNQRIMEAAEQLGHSINFINIEDCVLKIEDKKQKVFYKNKELVHDFEVVIPRIKPRLHYIGTTLIRYFENQKVYCVNSSKSILQSIDTFLSLQLITQNGLEIPVTNYGQSTLLYEMIHRTNQVPVTMSNADYLGRNKPIHARTKKEVENYSKKYKNIFIQEHFEYKNRKDIRIYIIDRKGIASYQKIKPSKAHQNSDPQYKPIKLNLQEKRMARLAAKAVGLNIAAVDIIRTTRGPIFLKIHAIPSIENFERIDNVDLAQAIIKNIEKHLKWV